MSVVKLGGAPLRVYNKAAGVSMVPWAPVFSTPYLTSSLEFSTSKFMDMCNNNATSSGAERFPFIWEACEAGIQIKAFQFLSPRLVNATPSPKTMELAAPLWAREVVQQIRDLKERCSQFSQTLVLSADPLHAGSSSENEQQYKNAAEYDHIFKVLVSAEEVIIRLCNENLSLQNSLDTAQALVVCLRLFTVKL